MQRQHVRLLAMGIILLIVICFILWRADNKMNELDQQMPVIGSLYEATYHIDFPKQELIQLNLS